MNMRLSGTDPLEDDVTLAPTAIQIDLNDGLPVAANVQLLAAPVIFTFVTHDVKVAPFRVSDPEMVSHTLADPVHVPAVTDQSPFTVTVAPIVNMLDAPLCV
jgi:hypothetical protein